MGKYELQIALYDRPVLEPLTFESTCKEPAICDFSYVPEKSKFDASVSLMCLLCDVDFHVREDLNALLHHIASAHHLVISDVPHIANFKEYLLYWKKRFSEGALSEFCSVVQTNSKPTDPDPSEIYYLLSDALPEDLQLRSQLQQIELQHVLDQQQKEREETNFIRDCLFCNQHFEGNRSDLFEHMAEWHHFDAGLPDNLVYIDAFLNILEEKLHSLKCLYCEKTFKDAYTLKEHMRKKRHKRFRRKNATYHRFFITNYLEPSKNWKDLSAADLERRDDDDSESDDNFIQSESWDDWIDISGTQTVCLFCKFSSISSTELIQHLQKIHKFDLSHIHHSLKLNFYQKVKLINYIRRQIHQNICHYCLETCSNEHGLEEHMLTTDHISMIPDISIWDQPQYFFPTYENDNLLCLICTDDDNEDVEKINLNSGPTIVVPEDLPVIQDISILKQLSNFDQLSL